MYTRRLRRKLETAGLIGCMTVVIVAYQNCGQPTDVQHAKLSSSTDHLNLHFLNTHVSSKNLHGISGEFVGKVPSGEFAVAALSDVNADGIEDVLTASLRSQVTDGKNVVTNRKLRIRSGKTLAQLRELNLPDYASEFSHNFSPDIRVIDDVNQDGFQDILFFVSRGPAPTPLSTYQNYSEGVIYSGSNFSILKNFRIQDPRPMFVHNTINVMGDEQVDLVLQATAVENENHISAYIAFSYHDAVASAPLIYDLSAFSSRIAEYSVQFDFDKDGKADLSTLDPADGKIKAFHMGDFSAPFFVKDVSALAAENRVLNLEDWNQDGFPELSSYIYSQQGPVLATELSVYRMQDLHLLFELKAAAGKYFSSLRKVLDVNGDGHDDVVCVQKDLQDISSRIEKLVIKDPVADAVLYEVLLPTRENANYSALSGFLIRSRP